MMDLSTRRGRRMTDFLGLEQEGTGLPIQRAISRACRDMCQDCLRGIRGKSHGSRSPGPSVSRMKG